MKTSEDLRNERYEVYTPEKLIALDREALDLVIPRGDHVLIRIEEIYPKEPASYRQGVQFGEVICQDRLESRAFDLVVIPETEGYQFLLGGREYVVIDRDKLLALWRV